MPEHQLFLPGMQPRQAWYFPGQACGSNEYRKREDRVCVPAAHGLCEERAGVLAVYFRLRIDVGTGREYIDEDSDRAYACGFEHLESIIHELRGQWPEMTSLPDIVTNAQGEIQKEVHNRLAVREQGTPLHKHYFTEKSYSNGRESLERFWSREKWRVL